jgi:very-short-patch-repair endonuclease
MGEKGHIASKIAHIAERQYGHITREQLLDLGLESRAVTRMAGSGRLIRVHHGVYAVGHPRPEAIAVTSAALLACGPDAAVSHQSAAALWNIIPRYPRIPEITTTTDRRREGIKIHRNPSLEARDVRRHQNLRITSPARTIFDLTPRLTDKQLIRAFNEARLQAKLKPEHLKALVQRQPASPRVERISDLLDLASEEPTRSVLEDEFLTFIRNYGLPVPETNAQVGGYLVDALFEEAKVIVELDGRRFHIDNFEQDRERDAALAELGYVTIRITWRRLRQRPAQEASRLRAILEQRGLGRVSYQVLPSL